MNIFEEAGKRFLYDHEKYSKARAKAITELDSIQTVCEMGVSYFYKAITESGQPDVQVTRRQENLVTIDCGLRICGHGTMQKGPIAAILVTSEGEIFVAKQSEWLPASSPDPKFKAESVSIDSWDTEISQWLIEFLQESEEEYRGLRH